MNFQENAQNPCYITIYTCLGMFIESSRHVGTMVCLLRRLGLLHDIVRFQLQNLQLQQHFSANIVQCLSTPVSGCSFACCLLVLVPSWQVKKIGSNYWCVFLHKTVVSRMPICMPASLCTQTTASGKSWTSMVSHKISFYT